MQPAYKYADRTGFGHPWELIPVGNYTLRTKDGAINGYNAEFQFAVSIVNYFHQTSVNVDSVVLIQDSYIQYWNCEHYNIETLPMGELYIHHNVLCIIELYCLWSLHSTRSRQGLCSCIAVTAVPLTRLSSNWPRACFRRRVPHCRCSSLDQLSHPAPLTTLERT